MATPSPAYLAIIRAIDKFTTWSGYLFAVLLVPLVLANTYEVIARYVFDRPTIWALDLTTLAFGSFIMLGAAYALVQGAHVRTDMFFEQFSERRKGTIDSCAYIFFFLPTMVVLFWISWDDFLYAIEINETSNSGAWQPVLWPLRGVIPLTAALLFIQGISELMKSLWAARTGEVLVHHEKTEI